MSVDFTAIRERVNLVELVTSHGVELRKSGAQFVGLCPFHGEKTPSFYVHPERGFYCHGCAAKGDALDFLRLVDGLTLEEALERLDQGTTAANRSRGNDLTGRAPVSTEPSRDAAALWACLPLRDDVGDLYLAGRGLLYRDPDVVRFNVGASGDWWLDERAREGFRVAFAVRNALGQVQTLSLRRVSEEEPKKLSLAGCPTSGAAIVSPGIEQLAGGDAEFAADRVLVLEGGTSWLGAAALFSQASADYGSPATWPLGAIGVSQAAGAVSAFSAVVRWRTVLVGLDADEAGRRAAPDVEEAVRKAGARDVIRAEAPGAKDWAELCLRWQRECANA